MKLARLQPLALSLSAALTLWACGGSLRAPDTGDAGSDGGLQGADCQFDSDCHVPDLICASNGTCQPGCTTAGCPSGKACNAKTGRCDNKPADGGTDGGTDAGSDAGTGGVGTPSDTLCKPCTLNGDCHAGGLCVSDSAHTTTFCTQDCTDLPCPSGFVCTVDRTGTKHQCYPSSGECPGAADGGTDGGPTDGGTGDPGLPSTNPNGCGFCGTCNVNNDCATDSVCVQGACASPCSSYVDCLLDGAIVANCAAVDGQQGKYCLPFFGACLPLPSPLGGDTGCVPSGVNPNCSAGADLPASMGANVLVQGTSSSVLLASEDSITVDSQGRMAIGYIGVDGSGSSYMGAAYSTDDGAHWAPAASNSGKIKATTPVQSDPVLVTSKWTDGSGAHERMHYVWVGYTIDTSNPSSPQPKDMFMESSYSDDGGAHWSDAVQVTTTADNQSGAKLLDKPWVAVGPDQSLMLTFSIGDQNTQHMFARVSTDHGQSWGSQSYPIENGDDQHGHNLGMPVFDPRDASGNTVYVTYVNYTQIEAGTSNSILLVKSTDKGKTWSTPVTVSASTDQVLFEPPSIAIDKSGHVYVGYVAAPGSAGTTGSKYWDAMVALVDVIGSTPQPARQVRVNDDFPAGQTMGCFQHFHCMVAVDQATGKVFASFIDNRRANEAGGVYYTSSTDLGASWAANKRVSDADFPFNPDHSSSQLKFLGDYFGFIFDGSKLRFAWSDPRNGTASQVFYVGGTP